MKAKKKVIGLDIRLSNAASQKLLWARQIVATRYGKDEELIAALIDAEIALGRMADLLLNRPHRNGQSEERVKRDAEGEKRC